jgi:hypothetical protein
VPPILVYKVLKHFEHLKEREIQTNIWVFKSFPYANFLGNHDAHEMMHNQNPNLRLAKQGCYRSIPLKRISCRDSKVGIEIVTRTRPVFNDLVDTTAVFFLEEVDQ